jgi:hypothetical protein
MNKWALISLIGGIVAWGWFTGAMDIWSLEFDSYTHQPWKELLWTENTFVIFGIICDLPDIIIHIIAIFCCFAAIMLLYFAVHGHGGINIFNTRSGRVTTVSMSGKNIFISEHPGGLFFIAILFSVFFLAFSCSITKTHAADICERYRDIYLVYNSITTPEYIEQGYTFSKAEKKYVVKFYHKWIVEKAEMEAGVYKRNIENYEGRHWTKDMHPTKKEEATKAYRKRNAKEIQENEEEMRKVYRIYDTLNYVLPDPKTLEMPTQLSSRRRY